MTTQAEVHPLVLANDGFTLTRSDGVADTWSDIWKYQVPRGTELIVSPGDTFAVYLEDASAEVGNNDCQVKIEARNTVGSEVTNLLGPANYRVLKEFQDRDLMYRIRASDVVRVPSRYFLVVSVKDDGAIDESDSRFTLHIHQVYSGVGS